MYLQLRLQNLFPHYISYNFQLLLSFIFNFDSLFQFNLKMIIEYPYWKNKQKDKFQRRPFHFPRFCLTREIRFFVYMEKELKEGRNLDRNLKSEDFADQLEGKFSLNRGRKRIKYINFLWLVWKTLPFHKRRLFMQNNMHFS